MNSVRLRSALWRTWERRRKVQAIPEAERQALCETLRAQQNVLAARRRAALTVIWDDGADIRSREIALEMANRIAAIDRQLADLTAGVIESREEGLFS